MSDFPDDACSGASSKTATSRPFVFGHNRNRLQAGDGLSERVVAALAAEGISSVEDLAAKSAGQLLRLPGIGKAALAEIRVFLDSHHANRADAFREQKIRSIKAILAGYLEPQRAERAAIEIADIL